MPKDYKGRRFAAFLITIGLLTVAMFWGTAALFGTYAQVVGAVYFAYLTGQSATDWKKAQEDVG